MIELKITNNKIINFFNKNPSMDLERLLLSAVSLLEDYSQTTNGVVGDSEMKDYFKELMIKQKVTCSAVDEMRKDFNNLQENNKYVIDQQNQLSEKISTHHELLKLNIDKSLESFLTTDIISDKSNKQMRLTIQQLLADHHNNTKLFYTQTVQPNIINNQNDSITKSVAATENRLQNSMSDIKKNAILTEEHTSELRKVINEHIINTKISSKKGDISETKLLPVLTKVFPTAEIIHNGGGKNSHCCDYTINRSNGEKQILIENKDYSANIGPDNINKFISDIETNNSHGIFLSQNSGISGQNNYGIAIHKNNVLVYLHNVNYDPEKITCAVSIIDSLSNKLNEYDTDENTIPKDVLDMINIEFSNFNIHRQGLLTMTAEFQKKQSDYIKKLAFPSLEIYLNNKYAHHKSSNFICEYCGKGYPSRRGLASHKKGCMKKNQDSKGSDLEVTT